MESSKKERVLAVLNGEIPDRVPVFEYLIHDGVFEHFGIEPISAGNVLGHIAACSKCLDICHPLSGPYEPREEIREDGAKTVYERWMVWNRPAPPQSLPPDTIKAELGRQIERLENSIGGKYPSRDDLLEQARSLESAAGDMVYITISASAALPFCNKEAEILAYADYPELTKKRMRLENAITLKRLQATAYKELSPVAIIWNDIAYKNRLFFPHDVLEHTIFPPLAEICDLLHSRGIRVIFHSDGDVSPVLPSLIRCGIDGLNPLEISAGMNYFAFKREYGRKIALVGGMDAINVLALGSVDEVVEETKRLIDTAGAGGGLIAASSSGEINMGMPAKNITAYFETIWDYGRY